MKEKKGIYILPNLLTTANLFVGFYAIIAAINGDWKRSAIAIIIAAFLDGLDGRMARLTGTVTHFGVEYDSLADLVAFGLAPAILCFTFSLNLLGRWGWLAAFLYLACGTLRLARFNIQVNKAELRYFIGLPIPVAACILALSVLNIREWQVSKEFGSFFLLILTYFLSFFMISTFHYRSFKDLEWTKLKPFRISILAVFGLVIIMSHPSLVLWLLLLAYMVSGPIIYTRYFSKRKAWIKKESRVK
ncbi:MAG TPA: CDP-diacylglycerol--serine O-phosphatidyltransferase [Candidatus Desulfofervidus auxilii]|uniref:CDP-diacylglycerol--serine O-phosphatidyltransferase n=1 Tax=Desulfofervidus auxilii TaxID=1621989 RepID=A0A7V0IAG9_DESA2|nr:CDP-diacylglycerol--serine O-phosphatidyltransferase [Candidatus Desulfofervidus auxilii]